MIGILFALSASLSWGAGDFCGGLAARKINQFQVLLLTTSSSLLLLVLFALIGKESMPSAGDIVLAVIAGISCCHPSAAFSPTQPSPLFFITCGSFTTCYGSLASS